MRDLETDCSPVAVNEDGQMAGSTRSENFPFNPRACSWTPIGGLVDLGTLGGTYSLARAMSATAQIVGLSFAGEIGIF
jgi:uncharacterized membrane protein